MVSMVAKDQKKNKVLTSGFLLRLMKALGEPTAI
jgi:hypothetical protein